MNLFAPLKKINAICLLALCLGMVSTPALAVMYNYSESEKAVFSFYRLTRKTPSYEEWIINTPLFQKTAPDQQPVVLQQEKLRLQWGYGTYDTAKESLRIKMDIDLVMHELDGINALSFNFKGLQNGVFPYFPFPYGKDWIALLVNDLPNFANVPLGPNQTAEIGKYLKKDALASGKVVMRVRPTSADGTSSVPIDNAEQWMMLGEVGYLEFFVTDPKTGKDISLWSYTAPTFLTETEKILLPLMENNERTP